MIQLIIQVIFQSVPTKPTWWYVVQVAPRSKQIYEEHNLVEYVENADLASTSTPVQIQSDTIELDLVEYYSNIAESNVEPHMDNEEIQRQVDQELADANEEGKTSDEDVPNANEDIDENDYEGIMINDDELFIDIFAQKDLIDDQNDALDN